MNGARCRHLVIATGGTGGHVYPAFAIADAYRRRGGTVSLLIGGQHAAEHLALATARGIPAAVIRAPRRAVTLGGRCLFPFQLLWASLQAIRQLQPFKGAVVLGMGSFASVPTCLGALLLRRPLAIHEGNTVIGRANRLLARRARVLLTSFPLRTDQQVSAPVEVVGFPVRESLMHAAALPGHAGGCPRTPGLTPGKPVLLVFGGSQGATAINDLIDQAFDELGDTGASCQVLHLTGTDDNAARLARYQARGITAVVKRYETEMERCYLDADLVVCRAGAATIAEMTLFGKAAILIPLPTAADNHQAANATMIADAGAGVSLLQDEGAAASLASHLRAWLADPAPWQARGKELQRLAKPEAAGTIAERLLGI